KTFEQYDHLVTETSFCQMGMQTYLVSDFPLFPHFVLPLLPNQRFMESVKYDVERRECFSIDC
ncbi:hypothetical protein NA871_22585, partial [Escherichia coli]|nr:hypothetical protein [Escherichia coli]